MSPLCLYPSPLLSPYTLCQCSSSDTQCKQIFRKSKVGERKQGKSYYMHFFFFDDDDNDDRKLTAGAADFFWKCLHINLNSTPFSPQDASTNWAVSPKGIWRCAKKSRSLSKSLLLSFIFILNFEIIKKLAWSCKEITYINPITHTFPAGHLCMYPCVCMCGADHKT